MRPPEFTGGNTALQEANKTVDGRAASMRPPEFTGGNFDLVANKTNQMKGKSFNEAAGIHRRKRDLARSPGATVAALALQ